MTQNENYCCGLEAFLPDAPLVEDKEALQYFDILIERFGEARVYDVFNTIAESVIEVTTQ